MRTAATKNIELRLTRARTHLLLNHPFFGTLALRLKLESGSHPTMATDGKKIVYNPSFVASLTEAELEGTVAHEVMHCCLGHHCRRGGRDPELWNRATDYAINPILLANGLTLPQGVLVDPSFRNLSAEEIYARLVRSGAGSCASPQSQAAAGGAAAPSNGGVGGGGSQGLGDDPQPENQQANRADNGSHPTGSQGANPSGIGEVWDATDDTGTPASHAELSRQQHEWSIAADQAMQSAKACGHEPASVARPLSESRESKQDWRAILRDFIAASAPSDYRWSPPNRRHIASGFYLPSVEKRGIGKIVLAVDTSGSIGTRELEQFAGEITALTEETQPEATHVVYCDATVQSTQEFGPSERIQLEPKGGGGTDFRPVFDWVEANQLSPACLIYLTDLCCHSFPEAPNYPVLWVTDSRRRAPVGETIRIDAE